MIQLQAAARLKVMAKADSVQARKYLESLGLSVMRSAKPRTDEDGIISFYLNDEFADAVDMVTSVMGKPPKVLNKDGRKSAHFKVAGGKRFVVITQFKNMVEVSLTDKEDIPKATSPKFKMPFSRRLK